MAWVIQRTAPHEPTSFWGKPDRWISRRRIETPAELAKYRVPDLAVRFESWEVASDIAEWLRTHQPPAWGEVIAVITEPGST